MPVQSRHSGLDQISLSFEESLTQLRNLVSLGIALSAEKNRDKLLDMIIFEARRISNADAGTMYLVEGDYLRIKIIHNQTLDTFLGGHGEDISWPPVPIKPEYAAGYVAITGISVNISNIYTPGRFDFSGAKKYDSMSGYHSVSMLVIPLKNNYDEVIGVLQLINAIDPASKEIIPFNPVYQTIIEALSSLAAIALTNTKLVVEIEELFESFVQVMVTAIDARTPYNATHTQKVSQLATLIAEEINDSQSNTFSKVYFNEDRLKQLAMAAWFHDIGKIATPLEVMNKATRLDSQLPLLLQRIDYVLELEQKRSLAQQLELWKHGAVAEAEAEVKAINERILRLENAKELIIKVNNPATFISDQIHEELKALFEITYLDKNGVKTALLSDAEYECLNIKRGTLTDQERIIMEDHVKVTERMLAKIPFTRRLLAVPKLACMHHEYIDGQGYPYQLKGEQIPLDAKILVIADIFDALTASDRPYRKAISIDKALQIMMEMAKEGKIDSEIMELFIQNKVWEKIENQDPIINM